MKNDRKAIVENTKLKSWDYPKYRVWFQFSFIGSLIGTFIFSMVFFILDKIKHPMQFDPAIIFAPFVIALFGWMIGFLPALLTRFIVAFAKFRIVNQKSYRKIFLIGFFSTAFLLYIWLMFQQSSVLKFDYRDVVIFLSIASTGGLSSVICGKLFLPKVKDVVI